MWEGKAWVDNNLALRESATNCESGIGTDEIKEIRIYGGAVSLAGRSSHW